MTLAVNPLYVLKLPSDISRVCISFISDSHPVTISRRYWTKITEQGYKDRLENLRPSVIDFIKILDRFDMYIENEYNNLTNIQDLLYLPEMEALFFENYLHQQYYIDRCIIITSYLKEMGLDFQLKFLFQRLLTIQSFGNYTILTVPFVRFTKEAMRNLPIPTE